MREHPPLAASPSSFPEKNYPLPLGFVTLILHSLLQFQFLFHSLIRSLIRSHFPDKRMKR